MKKVLALAALLFIFLDHLQAQSNFSVGGYYSLAYTSKMTSASSDLSWLNNEIKRIESPAFGYQVGANAEKIWSEKVSVSAGLGYSTYHSRIDSLENLGVDKFEVRHRFIEVPVLVKYSFGTNKYVKPYLSLGYVINIYTNTQMNYSYVGSNRNSTTLVTNDFNTINHAVRLAVGYDFALDKKWNLRTELFGSSFVNSLTHEGIGYRPIALGVSLSLRKGIEK